MKKKKLRLICLLMATLLVFSACGKKDTTVTDYGSESGESSDSDTPKTSTGATLSEMLGGEELTYSNTFNIEGKAAEIDVKYSVKDTDNLCIFNTEALAESEVDEDAIVKNIFGDSGTALNTDETEFLKEKENAAEIVHTNNTIVSMNGDTSNSYTDKCRAWIDNDNYFLHTYQGKYNGLDYQLLISYSRTFDMMTVALYPIDPGELSGNPDLDQFAMSYPDGSLYVYNDSFTLTNIKLDETMSDRPNECTLSDDELKTKVTETMSKFLGVNYPKESVSFYSTSDYIVIPDGTKLVKNEIVYYNEDSLNTDNLDGAVRDGYQLSVMFDICDQYVRSSVMSTEANMLQSGSVLVDDSGVIGFNVSTQYKFKDKNADGVSVLSFKGAMDSFVDEAGKNCELKDFEEADASIKFTDVQFVYFPLTLDDGTIQLTPAWELLATNDKNRFVALVYINAVDGSYITTQSYDDIVD